MNSRSAVTRLVMLTTLAALAATMVGTTAVQARDVLRTDRHVLSAGDPGRETAGIRQFRRVDVGSLPAATGNRPSYEPALRRPDGTRSPAAPGTQGAVPPPPVQTTSNGDPAISQATAFAGLAQDSRPATNGEPPDPWVATGPEHVLQAVNTTFQITDRKGAGFMTVDMFNFFSLDQYYALGEVAFFDPRVIFDSLHNRWIAIEASFDCFVDLPNSTIGTGYLDIAISDGPDPTAGWGIISIAYPDSVPDYPGLGTSTDKVVLSDNVYLLDTAATTLGCDATNTFLGTEMDVMAWSELIGTGNIYVDYLYSPRDFPNQFFAWRPALQTPATSATVFAIAERDDGGVEYARITGSPAAAGVTSIAISDLTGAAVIAPFDVPPPPAQPGSPSSIADAVDERPTDAVWKDNKLAFVSTYPCDATGGAAEIHDCVRVSELSTAVPAAPTLIQDVLIAQNTFDLYMGGIGYALNDDLHIVWTRSSANAANYPTSFGAYQRAAAAINTISTRSVLTAGTGTYPGTRWGDYVGVAQDPQVPNAVWQANEYSVGLNGWATEVTQLQTGGSTYVPIDPVRVLDTRPGITIGLSGPFSHGIARSWTVAGFGGGTIPSGAIAVTGNLTVTNQTAAGYVSVTPAPNNNPSSSTINFPLGDNRANNLTIPVNTDGKISAVYRASAGKTLHLIFDVTGYFVAGSGEAEYKTITPVRALDSRPGINIGLSGAFQKDVPRELSIGPEHVPPEAVAITGNMTVVGQTGAGFLAITPVSDATPATSNLNFPLGDTRANGFVAPLDPEDDIWIVYKTTAAGPRSTHVVLDVTGYFVDDASGLQYFPLTPGRVMDTRNVPLSGLTGFFNTNTPRKLVVGGHWGVPMTAGAITGNLTAVGQTSAGFVAVTLVNDPNPTTSNLNFPLGDVRANGITVPVAGGTDIWIVYKTTLSGKKTNLILDVSGYFN